MWYRPTRLLLLFVMLSNLSGCLGFTAASVFLSSGIAAFNDRRHLDVAAVDSRIIDTIEEKILQDNSLEQQAQVLVFSYNQKVLLRGYAPSETLRLRAVELALATDSVRQVYNQIKIGDKLGEIARSNDMLLSASIQATLISVVGIDASHPQILISNGDVYLMGLLTREETQALIPILEKVDGVRSVNSFVEYVKILPRD